MNGTLRGLFLIAAVACPLATAEAVMVSMTLDPGQSSITLDGEFASFPFSPQAAGSDVASYSGSLLVDLDSFFSPTSLQIVGGSATASNSGSWLPQAGGGTAPGMPGAMQDANYGLTIDLGNLAGGQDAYGAGRNFAFDVTSGAEAVVGGNFASNQTLTYLSGTFDGNAPPVPALMFPGDVTSLALTGLGLANASATSSTYVVVGSTATLTIPIEINATLDDLTLTFAGQLVATARVPEPSSLGIIIALIGGFSGMGIVARRRR